MIFQTPLGLLGLIGVLLLILIYVLKPKFQEKSISSTFVWKLSLKYKRHKMPFQWLKSSLLVILQFLVLFVIILSLTTPLFALDTKSGEKIIILDASANMLIESDGRTRFERAVQEIGAIADRTTPDDRFTVILAGKEASFIARRLDSAKFIKQLLSEQTATYVDADISAAVSLTEGVLAENPNAEVILFTGNQYAEVGLIEIRDMSKSEWNIAVLDFSSKITAGYHTFKAEIASYNKDMNVQAKLFINDILRDIKTVDLSNNQETILSWDDLNILNYDKAEIILEYEDDFIYDNRFAIYSWENETFNVQLVSESPRFIQSALLAIGGYKVTIPTAPDDQTPLPVAYQGYDLYIFDGYVPSQLPLDGSVWLINLPTVPVETGLTVGSNLTGDFTLSGPGQSTTTIQKILNGVDVGAIDISAYRFLSDYDDFEVILYNESDPVVLLKDMDGPQLIVFGFSLHNSNLPIIPEYIILMHNLARYSVQNMIESFLHYAGDEIQIRKKPSALQMRITYDGQTTIYNDFPVNLTLDRPGTYTITQTLVNGEEVSVGFYVRIARNQSDLSFVHEPLSNPIVTNSGDNIDANHDTLDIIYYLVGFLMLLLLIEWGLHYNEHD
jgi:Ca-activated chloride channel homolog